MKDHQSAGDVGRKPRHNNQYVLAGWLAGSRKRIFINDLKILWRLLSVSALCRGGKQGRGVRRCEEQSQVQPCHDPKNESQIHRRLWVSWRRRDVT